ncbi:MAG: VanZ family protein [Bacteroidales bacterium]
MRVSYFLPALGWALIVLAAISMPASRIPGSDLLKLPHIDKLIHGLLFMVFAILLAYGFFRQNKQRIPGKYYLILTLSIGIIYGLATELMQFWMLPGRHGNLGDFIANTIGTIFGLLLFRAFIAGRLKKPA